MSQQKAAHETRLAEGLPLWPSVADEGPPEIGEWQRGGLATQWPEMCPECKEETKGRYYSAVDHPTYWQARVCERCGRPVWISQTVTMPRALPGDGQASDTVPLPSQKAPRTQER